MTHKIPDTTCTPLPVSIIVVCTNDAHVIPQYLYFVQAHLRLNYLHVAVSPDATLGLVDKFSAGFDLKVMTWMKEIKDY